MEAVFRYPEETNVNEILSVLEARADEMGLMYAKLENAQCGLVTMRFDRISSGDYNEILEGLTVRGKLEFQDYEGNVLLSNDDIAKAYSRFGKLSENGVGEHYIELVMWIYKNLCEIKAVLYRRPLFMLKNAGIHTFSCKMGQNVL